MTDGIIKGSGNSRYLKTVQDAMTLYPTYESFLQALIAGTLPIDLNGINAAGWQTEGTALNKANLLSDATAAAMGLGGDPTVDGALSQLHTGVAAVPMVKLFDVTVGEDESVQNISFDLSTIDLREYRGMELYFTAMSNRDNFTDSMIVFLNNETQAYYRSTNATSTSIGTTGYLCISNVGATGGAYPNAYGSGKITFSFAPTGDGTGLWFSASMTGFFYYGHGSSGVMGVASSAGAVVPGVFPYTLDEITTLDLNMGSGTFAPGSSFVLYGIRR